MRVSAPLPWTVPLTHGMGGGGADREIPSSPPRYLQPVAIHHCQHRFRHASAWAHWHTRPIRGSLPLLTRAPQRLAAEGVGPVAHYLMLKAQHLTPNPLAPHSLWGVGNWKAAPRQIPEHDLEAHCLLTPLLGPRGATDLKVRHMKTGLKRKAHLAWILPDSMGAAC